MKYGLSSIGLTDTDLIYANEVSNLEIIFDEMDVQTELIVHVSAAGNMADDVCPETRGVFRMSKIDTTVASVQFTVRATGKFYSGTFIKNPLGFWGWNKAMTPSEEDYDDYALETQVAALANAIGDLSLVDHYGGDIVSILNKYTRQVFTDNSAVANKILLENYYGNIQDITYDTPILVQVVNNSVNGTTGEITFNKDIYENQVFVETITESYPLLMSDLAGAWNSTRAIAAGDLTKNVFYNIIKRQYESSPGIMSDCFVVLSSSGESEILAVSDRVTSLESYLSTTVSSRDTFNIYKIIATVGEITTLTSTTVNSTTVNATNLTLTGALTLAGVPKFTIHNGVTISGSSNIYSLIIDNNLNLQSGTVTLKSSPGNSDLVNKSYVDTTAATVTNAKFRVGTEAPPAIGTPGTFYFQLS